MASSRDVSHKVFLQWHWHSLVSRRHLHWPARGRPRRQGLTAQSPPGFRSQRARDRLYLHLQDELVPCVSHCTILRHMPVTAHKVSPCFLPHQRTTRCTVNLNITSAVIFRFQKIRVMETPAARARGLGSGSLTAHSCSCHSTESPGSCPDSVSVILFSFIHENQGAHRERL